MVYGKDHHDWAHGNSEVLVTPFIVGLTKYFGLRLCGLGFSHSSQIRGIFIRIEAREPCDRNASHSPSLISGDPLNILSVTCFPFIGENPWEHSWLNPVPRSIRENFHCSDSTVLRRGLRLYETGSGIQNRNCGWSQHPSYLNVCRKVGAITAGSTEMKPSFYLGSHDLTRGTAESVQMLPYGIDQRKIGVLAIDIPHMIFRLIYVHFDGFSFHGTQKF